MRLSVSCTARLFGRPVSASVAARSSAIARLRRLASTGAAWLTESRDTLVARRPRAGRVVLTSTEPITSPPTSSGSHVRPAGDLPQSSQLSSGSYAAALLVAAAEPHGEAGARRRRPASASASSRAAGIGVARLEPVVAVVAVEHDHGAPAIVRSRCALEQLVRLVLGLA